MAALKIVTTLSIITIFFACGGPTVDYAMPAPMQETPKNVILLIGDGMGLAQISAAMHMNHNSISFEKFPVIGLHKSHSYNKLITDSAAGATAFACGVKTYYNAIGVDKDTIPCKTIIEEAEENNLATGIVVTSTLVHATPASFYAHQTIRTKYEEIAIDLVDSNIDFMVGGGKRYFDRREKDDRNLYKELQRKNYQIGNYFNSSVNQLSINTNKPIAFFTADTDPLPVDAGRDYLTPVTKKAMQYLEGCNENGFFLMVEGSQIDWVGHSNNGKLVVEEMLDFNKMVEAVLAYAAQKGNTLVVVTADHETGGMSLVKKPKMKKFKMEFTTNGHTATLVPVFAYGPSAELFRGIYDNTAINHKIRQALGFTSSEPTSKQSD